MVKFVSDLQQVGGFLRFSSTSTTDHHNITEILLKVVLNTISQTITRVDTLSKDPGGSMIHTSLSPIQRELAPGFVNYKKGCTRLAAASDQVYQLLDHDR